MTHNEYNLKGIVFDKDGTLFDYAHVWAEVLSEAITTAFAQMGKNKKKHQPAQQAMLKLMGIDKQGNTLAKGLVFTHKKRIIIRRFLLYCLRYRINAVKTYRTYHNNIKNSEKLVEERLKELDFSMQQKLFEKLKQEGYRIGIITSDTESSSKVFLHLMGIDHMVDFLSTRDSKYHKKPHPQAFDAFCSRFSLASNEVAMVGDTQTDMHMAKKANAGYIVAVLTGSNDKKMLDRYADVVYEDISSLFDDTRIFPPTHRTEQPIRSFDQFSLHD